MSPDDFIVLPIPAHPNTQALTSSTFCKPPLDGSLSVPELYDWHYKNTPDHPIFVYLDDAGVETVIKWPTAVRAVHRAGRIVQSLAESSSAGKGKRFTFAILAAVDTITYFTMAVGILRAGHVVFPISPRNSPAAIAHLLSATAAEYMLVGPESGLQALAKEVLRILDSSKSTQVPVLKPVPLFPDLYREDDVSNFELLPVYKPKWDDAAIILHSSGSTAFPKPIVFTYHRNLLGALTPFYGEQDLTGYRLACHSLPFFHGMGMVQTTWTASCGLVLTTFRPQSPAITPTPDSVLKGAVATHSDILFCVPSFVEIWYKNPDDMKLLQTMRGILYGGGPLSQAAGDHLIDCGVNVFVLYGSTEAGSMSTIIPRTSSKDWAYFKIPSCFGTKFVPDGNGNFELLVLPNPSHVPCVLNTVIDGQPAYASRDLLVPHPTKPGYWKVFGRADDQIMHSTGEKTNPGPLEHILNSDPHIQAAVLFGRGQFIAGVIVDPKAEHKFDPKDEEKLAHFRNAIWPTVERMNAYAPQHSRIFKEMILVSSPSKPFTYTAKATARRQAILQDYEAEIEAQYASVGETTQTEVTPPEKWDVPHVLPFVRAVVSEVLTVEVNDTEDFILKGCDSLQATWIRNTVLRALRDVAKVDTRALPNGLVYQYQTAASLTDFLCGDALLHRTGMSTGGSEAVNAMLSIVAKYSGNWPVHTPTNGASSTQSVLLTGTTGALGANVLAKLLALPDINKVYALNRKNDRALVERQNEAFVSQGLDTALLASSRLALIEADTAGDRLGLSNQLYNEIGTNVTDIIHLAWPVNFSLSLASFEPNVKFVRGLIDLALSSPQRTPPHLLFASTAGIIRQLPGVGPVKEEPVEPAIAVGSGYAESKWVAERLLDVAAEHTALRPVSVRIGQLCGGESGAWNPNEWLPSLVRSAVHLRGLPALDKYVSWVPLDTAADILIEMAQSNTDSRYLHLTHPRPIPWSSIIEVFSRELNIPVIAYPDWLHLLEDSAAGMNNATQAEVDSVLRQNPALKLLDLFRSAEQAMASPDREAMGLAKFDLTEALKAARSLNDLRQLDNGDVQRWLAYWGLH